MSRVDFDQCAGQYDLTAQTNFFDGDSGYFARYNDADAVLLSTRETVERMRNAHLHIDESSYWLFFPQQLAALRPFEKYLRWLPMGGQYFVCASNQKRDAA